jgi:hypothetical protein
MLSGVFSMLLSFSVVAGTASTAPSSPSSADLHELYKQGNYPELLQQLRIVLAQKDQSGVDRFDLLELKGEALLRTKSDAEAADAFGDAAKATKDKDQASLARATDELLRQSHSETYTPKTAGKTGTPSSQPAAAIDLIQPSSRKHAFAALFDDEMTTKSHQVDAVKKATTLPPILSIAPTLQTLQDLEHAGTGSTTKSGEMTKSVGDRARELIEGATKKLSTRIDELEKKSGQTEEGKGRSHYTRRRGLNSGEIDELHEMGPTCDEITAACKQLTQALGSAGGDFSAAESQAASVKSRANELAKKHTSKTVTETGQ